MFDFGIEKVERRLDSWWVIILRGFDEREARLVGAQASTAYISVVRGN
jgi:hypothetical protein